MAPDVTPPRPDPGFAAYDARRPDPIPKTTLDRVVATGVAAVSHERPWKLDGWWDWFKGATAGLTVAGVLAPVAYAAHLAAVNTPDVVRYLQSLGISPRAIGYVSGFGVACGTLYATVGKILGLLAMGHRVTTDPNDPARPEPSVVELPDDSFAPL